jgi:hypothetical protein
MTTFEKLKVAITNHQPDEAQTYYYDMEIWTDAESDEFRNNFGNDLYKLAIDNGQLELVHNLVALGRIDSSNDLVIRAIDCGSFDLAIAILNDIHPERWDSIEIMTQAILTENMPFVAYIGTLFGVSDYEGKILMKFRNLANSLDNAEIQQYFRYLAM